MYSWKSRRTWETIKMLEKLENEHQDLMSKLNIESKKNLPSSRIKRQMRQSYKMSLDDEEVVVVSCNGDYFNGYIKKKVFYNFVWTDEEKMEYLSENLEYPDLLFGDGRLYNSRIEICNFKEPNSFGAMSVIYTIIRRDIG